MFYSKLLKKFSAEKSGKKSSEFYLGLEIGDSKVKAAVWEYNPANSKIVIKQTLQSTSIEEAIQTLKEENPDFTKMILGLNPEAVEDNSIKKEEVVKIRPIAKKYGLTPVGFVVIPEAIAYLLKKIEETPQSAIFLHFAPNYLAISLFRGGKCKKYLKVPRTGRLFADFDEGLRSFATEEVLPSKIILYEGEHLEDTKEELLSYPWQKNLKFLHVPKIEVLPWDFSIKAIVEAGVFELSASAPAISTSFEEEKIEEVQNEQTVETALEDTAYVEEEKIEKDAMGFVKDQDIAETEEVREVYKPVVDEVPEENFGRQEHVRQRSKLKLPKIGFKLPSPSFFSNLTKFRFYRFGKIAPLIVLLIILGGVLISSLYFYPFAKIKLIAQPKILEKDIDVTLSSSITSPSSSDKEVPAHVYSADASGDKSMQTTGKKTIGEKAKGEVTIYNKTNDSKNFPKGTILSGPSGLAFTLDSDVNIASASDTGSSLQYGNTTVKVTAVKIGPSGNIKKDSDFKVGDNSSGSYSAKNNADFSGGTEREIDVVSKEDQQKLLTSLTDELKSKAKTDLEAKIPPSEKLLTESMKDNIVEKVFDKDVGDESDNLSLKLKVEFSALSYKADDLNNFFKQYITEQVPGDYDFNEGKSYFDAKDTKFNDDGSVLINALYHAYLLPRLDLTDFKKSILGKSKSDLDKVVKSMSDKGILGYELNYLRKFPILGSNLPFLSKNIEISVVSF